MSDAIEVSRSPSPARAMSSPRAGPLDILVFSDPRVLKSDAMMDSE